MAQRIEHQAFNLRDAGSNPASEPRRGEEGRPKTVAICQQFCVLVEL